MDELVVLMNGKYNKKVAGSVQKNPFALYPKKCDICDLVIETETKYKSHSKCHEEEGAWTCNDCDYQCNSRKYLLNHIRNAHEKKTVEVQFKCNQCFEVFSNNETIKKHMLNKHKTHKPCNRLNSSNPEERCKFGDGCYYSHVPIEEGKHRCYKCGDEFVNLFDLMKHRKVLHLEVCRQATKNNCQF